jgi:hypothetical protein
LRSILRNIAIGWLLPVSTCSLFCQAAALPDLGPNVIVFRREMAGEDIQRQIDKVYAEQRHSEFGLGRYAFVFLPGKYKVDVPIGFYTQVIGVGGSPDAVRIEGNVHSDAASNNNNATTTFWRGVEGFSVAPTGGTMQWAVSQAAPARRMHILGDMVLHQKLGWASGGWLSDSAVDGTIDSGSQQQWMSRNSEWGRWTGSNWNMMFVGVKHPPEGYWPKPPYTKIATSPVTREKPFLEVDARGGFGVRVPAIARNSAGVTWRKGLTPGRLIPISSFYIAQPNKDNDVTINAALARGMHLLLTPGTYELHAPIRVSRSGTVVLGLGFATLHPVSGTEAMTVADVDGVTVSGILFDAGHIASPSLLQVGTRGSRLGHIRNPISLHDVFFRVGGAGPGKTDANLVIDANDVIVDHTWIWRADHGSNVGWEKNQSQYGMLVRGSRVTVYGLFVEHHQKDQVLWIGEKGRTYFYQSEIPYDPPTQAMWSAEREKGFPSYKVDDAVKHHEAWGLGIYSVFRYPNVVLDRAIEAPVSADVRFHHMITVALGNQGAILNVIDDAGGSTRMNPRFEPKVTDYPER